MRDLYGTLYKVNSCITYRLIDHFGKRLIISFGSNTGQEPECARAV